MNTEQNIILQAIETRFLAPTNTLGSRVVAVSCGGSRLTLAWSHDLDAAANHRAVAVALMRRLGWGGRLVTGTLKHSYVHVLLGE